MDETGNFWESTMLTCKFWVAGLAIKWCGIAIIYWSAPDDWEEYMSIGEPYKKEKD